MYFVVQESGCVLVTVNIHAFCAFQAILYFITDICMFLKHVASHIDNGF
jgi:hypothetical protein